MVSGARRDHAGRRGRARAPHGAARVSGAGRGVLRCIDGRELDGAFVNGLACGHGLLITPRGDRYVDARSEDAQEILAVTQSSGAAALAAPGGATGAEGVTRPPWEGLELVALSKPERDENLDHWEKWFDSNETPNLDLGGENGENYACTSALMLSSNDIGRRCLKWRGGSAASLTMASATRALRSGPGALLVGALTRQLMPLSRTSIFSVQPCRRTA